MTQSQKGIAAVELALLLPVLLTIAFGIIQFGYLLVSYTMVIGAASVGAQYFSTQRGGSSTPLTGTLAQVKSSAGVLNTNNISITATVSGAACATDSVCATALSTAGQGVEATVTVAYTFTPLLNSSLFSFKSLMPSTLNSTVAERVL
jgi:Flp pilus assembly protein TadG